MTTIEEQLHRAVLEAPERDGPRRRYAEALERRGDELGEFIRLALDWDRNRLDGEAATRALVLHNQLRARLTAPLQPWIRSHQVDRGLVALVELDGRTFLDHGAEIFACAPIQHLNLVETRPVFEAIVDSPWLARVQTLDLTRNGLGDREAALLARSPAVRRLCYLSLHGNDIGEAGLRSIAASESLAALRVLHFGYNAVDSPVVTQTTDGVSGLSFDVGGGPLYAAIVDAYGTKAWLHPPPNLHRLRMCDAGE